MEITLPNRWRPRAYQRRLWDYLEGGGKRAIAVWHRRAGKDDVCLHRFAVAAHERVATYWHLLPEAAQARKAIWTAVNPHTGRRRIDEAFPVELRETTLENEMMIRFRNGSTYQLAGSDNYDSLVGSAPAGVVFSEWALANPNAWAFIRPMLLENRGWAAFIYTPRGRNHGSTFFDVYKDDPEWFVELLAATQTGVFTAEQLAAERAALVKEFGAEDGNNRFEQEYLCSFAAGVIGSYYGREMEAAEKEGRIGSVPWEPTLPVHTAWDLGIGDATAIWCVQLAGRETRCIDYLENSGVGIDWYVRELDKRPWKWGEHILPHDAEVKELGTGKSRLEVLASLGIHKHKIIPAQRVEDGINAARMLLPLCHFDKERCARGIQVLQNYRRAWDERRHTYHDRPYHDWASHGADAFRYLALAGMRNAAASKPIVYPKNYLGIV